MTSRLGIKIRAAIVIVLGAAALLAGKPRPAEARGSCILCLDNSTYTCSYTGLGALCMQFCNARYSGRCENAPTPLCNYEANSTGVVCGLL